MVTLLTHHLTTVTGLDVEYGNVITVGSVMLEPYIRPSPLNITHGIQYEGYIVDVLERITHALGLYYRIVTVANGDFGQLQPDGSWSGLMGQVVRREVDVAAAPLLITDDRQAAVDFSSPFLRGHATILIRKPDTKDRANPLLISSARDLVRQSELTFGTLNTGVLVKAFKTSNNTLYRTMWTQMSTRATTTVFTRTNQEGVTRVRRGGYAFILPSIIGDYVSRQAPCDLTTVDSFLLDMDYGLALPKGSGLRRRIDDVLASLRATGALGELYRKWWKQKVDCADDVVNTQAQQQRRLPVSVSAAAPVHVASVLICILPLLASLNLLFVCVRCAWYCHTDDV